MKASPSRFAWLNRTALGVIVATFFSDVGHEMATAVLPLFLAGMGLGPSTLGMVEGLADLLASVAKLAGGVAGHHLERKKTVGTLGYLVTALGTFGLAFAQSATQIVSLRAAAWTGRGFRSPLRDFILSDAVAPTHFGRVYGVERAADMFGALVGPLIAAFLLWMGIGLRTVILVSLAPSLMAAASFFFLTTEAPRSLDGTVPPRRRTLDALRAIPRSYWALVVGVFIFGLGDFSRTFLIFLAVPAKPEGAAAHAATASAVLGTAVLLYMMHNAVSAAFAFAAGHLGDRYRKLPVLAIGYGVGTATHLLLAFGTVTTGMLALAFVMSGVTVAIEETLEKASCAELLPRELRSLGLGVLAAANGVGDMVSSLFVGFALEHGSRRLAFGVPAVLAFVGTMWIAAFATRRPTAA